MQKWIQKARQKSKLEFRFNLIAFALDKRGRIISVGTNSYSKTAPQQAKYAKVSGNSNKIYLHAEIAALLKARRKVYTLIVIRLNKQGKPMLAKPCELCQLAISAAKVKNILHS